MRGYQLYSLFLPENALTRIVDAGDRENDIARRGKSKDFTS